MTNETRPEEIRNGEESQLYYDAMVSAGYFDINDLEKMRNLAVIKDGKVTYPLYDFMLGGEPPVYEDGKIKSVNPPTFDAVKRKLTELAKEGELYYYYSGKGSADSEPQKIEFSVQPDKKLKASLSDFYMYHDESSFPKPAEKPKELTGWRWFANMFTRGWAYRKEKEEIDTKTRKWEEDTRAYQKAVRDRKTFLRYKSVRAHEDTMKKDRLDARKYKDDAKLCQDRVKAIYGAQPKKIGVKNDNVVDLIQDTPYELPKGFTEELTSALGPMAMCDPDIAKLAQYEELSANEKKLPKEQQEEIKKGLNKNPFRSLMSVLGHGFEDIIADRENVTTAVGDCVAPARNKLIEALDDYRLNNRPEKLGEIIAQGAETFANSSSFSDKGITGKVYVELKSNAAVMDMLNTHDDIMKAAREKGLSDKALQILRAQKNIVDIHERDMAIRDRFLSGVPQNEEKTADDLADYLLGKMAKNTIIRQTNERDKGIEAVQQQAMQQAMQNGKYDEVGKIMSEAAAIYQINSLSSSAFDDFGKKDVETMRKEIKDNLQFKMMLKNIMEEQSLSPLCNEGKLNSLTNNLCTAVVHSEKTNSAMKSAERAKAMEEYNRNKNYEKSTTVGPNI